MAESITIRQIGADDWQAFKSIRIEALRLFPSAYAFHLDDALVQSDDDWQRRTTLSPIFIAFEAVQPIGIMGHNPNATRNQGHRTSLIAVYVKASRWGTGVAKNLLAAIEKDAKSKGIHIVELGVNQNNPRAQAFYKRQGYTQFGYQPKAMCLDGEFMDEVLMQKWL